MARRRDIPTPTFVDALTSTLVGAVLGGRALFVLFHWDYFQEHVGEIFALWQGGMHFHGAFLGGAIGLFLYARLSHSPHGWELADIFALGLAVGSIPGWLACLAGGCAYGVPDGGPFSLVSADIYGIEARRFAVQPISAGWSVIIVVLLSFILRRRRQHGLAAGAFLLLYFAGQLVLEFFRADEVIMAGPLRLTQIMDAALLLVGLGILVALRPQQAPSSDRAGAAGATPPPLPHAPEDEEEEEEEGPARDTPSS